jgi:hypothetical protein
MHDTISRPAHDGRESATRRPGRSPARWPEPPLTICQRSDGNGPIVAVELSPRSTIGVTCAAESRAIAAAFLRAAGILEQTAGSTA